MRSTEFADWQPMASAPRDSGPILVAVRASEQGPAEVDVVRWEKLEHGAEECWIADDSASGIPIIYAEAELVGWRPLPTPLPKLRSGKAYSADPARVASRSDEMAGSGI